jgi:hypothetical protein
LAAKPHFLGIAPAERRIYLCRGAMLDKNVL